MKSKSHFILCFVSFGMLSACALTRIPPPNKEKTYFPASIIKDYDPKGYTARSVFPSENKKNIFIKGSSRYSKARISEGNKWVELNPPYYTDYLQCENDSCVVEFYSDNGNTDNILVFPVKHQKMKEKNEFSFLVYGCFQPFDVNNNNDSSIVRNSTELEYEFRKSFEKIALDGKMYYTNSDKDPYQNLNGLSQNNDFPKLYGKVLASPSLVIGTGDQVYVDAAYHSNAGTNPISAWQSTKNPQPLLDIEKYIEHLNDTYSHFWSFSTMEKVAGKIPFIAAMDDHEIRDGWGSQGDEYPDSRFGIEHIVPELKDYFHAGRQAFYEHQLATGPAPKNYGQENPKGGFHLELKSNGLPIFVFDLRSHRNIHSKKTMNKEQLDSFEKWLDELDNDQEIVVVSSIPFFWKIPFMLRQSMKIKAELRDDLSDFWSNDSNRPQRDRILSLLLKARLEKNIKPIILSGDVHAGVLNEIWYTEYNKQGKKKHTHLLAYEMIISGFAHQNLSEQTFAGSLKEMANASNGEIIKGIKLPSYNTTSKFKLEGKMRLSAAKLNFGAIEHKDSNTFLNFFFKDEANFIQVKVKGNWEQTYDERQEPLYDTDQFSAKPMYLFPENGIQQKLFFLSED